MKETRKSTRSTAFTDEERGAMKERAREARAAGRRPGGAEADGESEVLEKIARMTGQDRVTAQHVHAIVKASAPSLSPRTWYGMPAYARDGKIICHFQPAEKFKTRYATLGFSDNANLDEGALWPVAYAVPEWTPAAEEAIGALVKKAVS